jgi:hypothetical protein
MPLQLLSGAMSVASGLEILEAIGAVAAGEALGLTGATAASDAGSVAADAAADAAANARTIVSQLQSDLFQPGMCKECANAIAGALKSNNIEGSVLDFSGNLKNISKTGDFMVNDLVGGGTTITTNGTHTAVNVGDVIFDNFFQEGVNANSYLNAMNADGGWTVTITKF